MPDGPALWEAVHRAPHPRLRGAVLSYSGYVEYAPAPMRRLEVPFAGVPLILSLGPSLLVDGVRHRSFVAGLDDRATLTEYAGEQRGIAGRPHAARRAPPARPADERADAARRRARGRARRERHAARRASARRAELGRRASRCWMLSCSAGSPQRRRWRRELERAWARLESSAGAVGIDALAARGRLEPAPSRGALSRRRRPAAEGRRADPALRARDAGAARGRRPGASPTSRTPAATPTRRTSTATSARFAGTTPTAFVARLLPGGAGVAGGDWTDVEHGAARAA